MRKLMLLPLAVLVFGSGFMAHQPTAKVLHDVKTKTVTVQQATPTYRVGDSQDGVTLVGVYPYSYQNLMAGNGPTPPTVNLLYFVVAGVTDLPGHTQVLTNDGNYLVTDGPETIAACGDNPCVGYINTGTPATFYYRNLKWSL